ncbi:MAG: Sec-independent protein translocase subunit TatB [Rhodocyclales bacterium]|nr:Sec-independent protein translocase subunit TatB [Rhodocyclales bacterium]
MFDIGFSELMVIALVALIVIGPERLPRVARTAGHLLGRLQRYVGDVKADINREIQLDELKKMQQDVEQTAREMESSVTQQMSSIETSLNDSILPGAEPVQPPAEAPALAEEPAPSPAEALVAEPGAPAPQLELGFEQEPPAAKKTA